MKIKDVMNGYVATVDPGDSVVDVAKRMRDENIGCVVVAEGGTVTGILTDRDLTIKCLSDAHDHNECTAADYMTTPVVTIGPEADILDAARLMNEQRIKRLPVVDGGVLAGIVSFSDIAQALAEPVSGLFMGMGAARRAPVPSGV